MRRFRTVGLVVAIVLPLAASACRSSNAPTAKKEALTRTELFDLRTKCSELARKDEEDFRREAAAYRTSAGDINSFTNRYDPETNRCYVERFTTHYQKAKSGESQIMQYRSVSDAQENAQMMWCNDYVLSSGPHQTTCTDKDSKPIPVNEANVKMNNLMGESVDWP